jgi:hypothetical protein
LIAADRDDKYSLFRVILRSHCLIRCQESHSSGSCCVKIDNLLEGMVMGDTRFFYERMRDRARHLVEKLDDAMAGVLVVDQAVDEVMKADMDNPGELSPTDAADLRQSLENALFSLRAAERIAVEHTGDVARAMRDSAVGGADLARQVALQCRADRGDDGLHVCRRERVELRHVTDHADADQL